MEHIPDPEHLKGDVYAETFPEIIGVDPFLELVRGRAETIPRQGWMIRAEILPTEEGGAYVTIYKYSEGDFRVSFSNAGLKGKLVAEAYYTLPGGFYSVSYDASPSLSARNLESSSARSEPDESREVDGIVLENGGLLTRRSGLMTAHDEGVRFNTSRQGVLPDELAAKGEWVHVDRVVADLEGLGAVLVGLGALMGLKQNDTHTLVTSVAQKIGHLA